MRKRVFGDAADTSGLQSSLTKRLAGVKDDSVVGAAANETLTDKLKRK